MEKSDAVNQLIIATFEYDREEPMRSLAELKKEAADINLQIRRLLLNHNSFSEGIADKLMVVASITTLREQLVKIQREIRVRFPDEE
ncbi:MAG TPA: hypothetical protein VHC47_01075 [Mucilaginibacter sp.]|nr:hypothetical protein [Mucilaginibacter sp.]